VRGYPERLANQWRLKASSQMVPALLYVVVYMRHTSNLEKAIEFASKNLSAPLALDFKRVFYEVEIGKYSTIKESLGNYLETWRGYSSEFIEAFHLIESSLFEPDEGRRVNTLEKALQVALDGVYDKMLKFTHTVRSPLTNVYMLGVVLPTLGLALLPLASALLGGILKTIHVFLIFNMIIPFLVFYLTDKVIFLRPGGHGQSELLEKNPYYYRYASKGPYLKAFFMCLPLFVLGLLPLIFGFTPIPDALGMQKDYTFTELGFSLLGEEKLFGFEDGRGPFGFGALILGMFFPLGVALFFSIANNERTKDLIVARDNTDDLEQEFNNSLFQLGNRVGNGMPPELAFGKVAESARGLKTEDFFRRVNYNVQQMGMGLDEAIFNPRRGALVYYPSRLIGTSMRILIEASKKGLKIAALSLMSISQYVKNIQKITQRLKDLLAEIVSDMKSNMTFLAPLLSGIVVGLAAMITSILARLKSIQALGAGGEALGGGLENVLTLFDVSQMIPSYYLQIFIGIYLIQIIFILTRTLVIVDSGEDRLKETSEVGKNLKRGIALYFAVALMSSIALFILSFFVLQGI
jgi:Flp pilus assembly protein TadB